MTDKLPCAIFFYAVLETKSQIQQVTQTFKLSSFLNSNFMFIVNTKIRYWPLSMSWIWGLFDFFFLSIWLYFTAAGWMLPLHSFPFGLFPFFLSFHVSFFIWLNVSTSCCVFGLFPVLFCRIILPPSFAQFVIPSLGFSRLFPSVAPRAHLCLLPVFRPRVSLLVILAFITGLLFVGLVIKAHVLLKIYIYFF